MPTTLIDPAELAAALQDPAAQANWAVVDCRFDLTRPDWGANAHAAGHIPGSVYAHLDHDLSGAVTPHSGRHPLPTPTALAATLGRFGIDASTQVVAYDQGNGAYAARLWWLLRWAGHRPVAVLNGGLAAWQHAGLPTATHPTVRAARRFAISPASAALVSTAQIGEMLAHGELASGQIALLDARGADRFAGENETLDPVAGHIPGARNHPFAGNVDAQGRFLEADALRNRWLKTLGRTTPQNSVSMCGSGVTACHNLLAMEVAGLPGARLYAGSWSEWIRDPGRPVARG